MDEFMHIDTTYPYPWMGVSVFESSDLDIVDFWWIDSEMIWKIHSNYSTLRDYIFIEFWGTMLFI
jgi:hypothetical protein